MANTNFPNGIAGPLTGNVTGNVTGGLLLGPAVVASANGAISIASGVIRITKAGICALTLANPTTAQNGMVIVILSTTANAHTVTYTAGFGGTSTAGDVATFGAAVGNSMTIIADNELWYVIALNGVTLG